MKLRGGAGVVAVEAYDPELAEKLEEDDNVLCGSPVASDDESDIAADERPAGRLTGKLGAAFAPHDELLLGGTPPRRRPTRRPSSSPFVSLRTSARRCRARPTW